MQRKQVIFVADSLDNAHKFQQVLSSLDVDVAAGSSAQFKKLLGQHPACDLVVYEARGGASEDVAGIEALLLEDNTASLLVIVGDDQLVRFRLPVQVKSDFVMRGASPEECAARIRQLLWPGNESATSDCLAVENRTVNLATYQVTVAGGPLDLTSREYARLAFLVTRPARTSSRDALLRRVWGFDYYGGSRTVDVHVRRIRAKLGPNCPASGNGARRRLPLERIGRAVRHAQTSQQEPPPPCRAVGDSLFLRRRPAPGDASAPVALYWSLDTITDGGLALCRRRSPSSTATRLCTAPTMRCPRR